MLSIGCITIGFGSTEGDDDTTAGGIFEHFPEYPHRITLKRVGSTTVKNYRIVWASANSGSICTKNGKYFNQM